jgi:hypothetical protein
MSTSSPAIHVRIGSRVGAAHLAVIAAVIIVGLLTGLHVAGGSPQPAVTHDSPVQRVLQVHGPQGHIADMIGLRSQLHGHRFPIPSGL